MALDREQLKFGGTVMSIAEDELSASVTDDENGEFIARLYREYQAQGKPKNPREWLRKELKKHFIFVTKPPVWIEQMTIPTWPFFAGKPMVFIEQFSVPENEVSIANGSAGSMLYVFCARKPIPGVPNGWETIYRVVEQVFDL